MNTFPNITGAITGTQTELNALTDVYSNLVSVSDILDAGDTLDHFEAGTSMVFYQASAPTGWTQDTNNSDAALRVVSSTGGGIGGTHDLSSPPSLTHTHEDQDHTLTTAEMPAHTHGLYNQVAAAPPSEVYGMVYNETSQFEFLTDTTGSTGGGGAHNHGTTSNNSSLTAFAPKYVDVIICIKS